MFFLIFFAGGFGAGVGFAPNAAGNPATVHLSSTV